MSQMYTVDEPLNELDRAIAGGRSGKVDEWTVSSTIWQSPLVIPSGVEATTLDDITPLLFDRDGLSMIAVFSDPRRISDLAQTAPFFIVLTGQQFLTRIRPNLGVVVNPRDLEFGLELFPDGIAHLVTTFA